MKRINEKSRHSAGFFHSNLLYNKMIFIALCISRCFQRAKVQDLDAIHNRSKQINIEQLLFSKSKSTRFRCNSQLDKQNEYNSPGCFQRAKVQDLDAIHNECKLTDNNASLFSKSKSTRFRCNSQPTV